MVRVRQRVGLTAQSLQDLVEVAAVAEVVDVAVMAKVEVMVEVAAVAEVVDVAAAVEVALVVVVAVEVAEAGTWRSAPCPRRASASFSCNRGLRPTFSERKNPNSHMYMWRVWARGYTPPLFACSVGRGRKKTEALLYNVQAVLVYMYTTRPLFRASVQSEAVGGSGAANCSRRARDCTPGNGQASVAAL